ncbi:cytochrome C peroxidase (plasmid) [Duffyella gerundensis]|uniref:Cytochrome C peroxidase n=2 Tax=Duffyella gerundensis TaxID=1619313 RepID=A0A0U5LAU8_9GAMM|nr:cytochrome C peroxidase [Duffyella gerundensis]
MPMSIQKIAHLAGVSVATVSRVLNNSDSVKDSNREKVLQAIANSNYQPNLLARQLRTARSSMILVMVSDIANPFCAEVVKGIEEQAEQNHYRILLCNSASDVARSRSSLQLLAGKIVDGVITMDAFSTLPELAPLIGARPWVQCAEYADDGAVSCVGINDVAAAQQLVGYLADGGRQRIALINHDLDYKYAQLRQQGYQRALAERQLSWQAIGYASALRFHAGKTAMLALLAEKQRPDAVFAVSDTLAAGAIAAITGAGLRVPEDIAVAGFDGTELAEMVSPPLTTLAQPSREMGRQACALLLKRINDPDSPAERIMMPWQLITRASA